MRKYGIFLAIFSLWFFCSAGICGGEDLAWENIGKDITDVSAVWVSSLNPQVIYLGSDKGIFKTEDGGTQWQKVRRGKRTEKGYYCALAVLPNGNIYLGTKGGLLISKDNGKTWRKTGEEKLGHASIQAVTYDATGNIYVASEGKIFKIKQNNENPCEKLLSKASCKEADLKDRGASEEADEFTSISPLKSITFDYNKPGHIYAVISSRILHSEDSGITWKSMPRTGLPGEDIACIAVSPASRIYITAKAQVFTYNQESWQKLPLGIDNDNIVAIAVDREESIYLATEKGLFKVKVKVNASSCNIEDSDNSDDEPTIRQVQQTAIDYAEVNLEKIKEWRRKAAKRALLPKLEIGFDKDVDKTVSTNTWGTYSNGTLPGRYYVGPSDESNYRNNNYSVSLTWELGDLIWSDDQTSIDVRSRLMVELRNDILDEVTRIYFERQQVKLELADLPQADKERTEKKIRLDELTAMLDGFTGGYFSRHLKK